MKRLDRVIAITDQGSGSFAAAVVAIEVCDVLDVWEVSDVWDVWEVSDVCDVTVFFADVTVAEDVDVMDVVEVRRAFRLDPTETAAAVDFRFGAGGFSWLSR